MPQGVEKREYAVNVGPQKTNDITHKRGGKRKGAGRPLGSKNKFQKNGYERAKKYKIHPIDLLLATVNDKKAPVNLRLSSAVAVLPYVSQRQGQAAPRVEKDHLDQMSPDQKIDLIRSLTQRIN